VARLTAVAAAAAVACVCASSAAARDYHGKAQALMPTPKEIGFAKVLQFKPAKKPASTLARGWQAGVAAIYAKGTTKSPVDAVATVYVYSGVAAAKTALQHACAKCPHVNGNGIQMRVRASKSNGATVVEAFAVCRNVYVNAVTTGTETTTKLATDAGTIGVAVYRRAIHFGMSTC
jgi:hypothetical protein